MTWPIRQWAQEMILAHIWESLKNALFGVVVFVSVACQICCGVIKFFFAFLFFVMLFAAHGADWVAHGPDYRSKELEWSFVDMVEKFVDIFINSPINATHVPVAPRKINTRCLIETYDPEFRGTYTGKVFCLKDVLKEDDIIYTPSVETHLEKQLVFYERAGFSNSDLRSNYTFYVERPLLAEIIFQTTSDWKSTWAPESGFNWILSDVTQEDRDVLQLNPDYPSWSCHDMNVTMIAELQRDDKVLSIYFVPQSEWGYIALR